MIENLTNNVPNYRKKTININDLTYNKGNYQCCYWSKGIFLTWVSYINVLSWFTTTGGVILLFNHSVIENVLVQKVFNKQWSIFKLRHNKKHKYFQI